MGFSAIANIVGAVLAIVGVVLYAVHLASFTTIWMCGSNNHDTNDNNCTFLANLAQVKAGFSFYLTVLSKSNF